MIPGEEPADGGSPIVSHQVGFADAERVHDAQGIPCEAAERIVAHSGRRIGVTEASLIERHRAITRSDQLGDHISPERRRVRKPVQEEHGLTLTLTLDVNVEFDSVQGNARHSKRRVSHVGRAV